MRELKNALRNALLLAASEAEDFPPVLVRSETPAVAPTEAARSLREAEADTIEAALRAAQGNVSRAARHLGVSRSTLYQMMDRMERPLGS